MINSSEYYKFDNKRVHNFSIGTLDAYFRLNKLDASTRTLKKFPGFFFMDRGGSCMTMVFDVALASTNIQELQHYQELGPVYSLDLIAQLDEKCASKFIEIGYDLSLVFNPSSYANAKKRHQRIVYPFKWLEKEGYTISFSDFNDYDAMIQLHDDWHARKEQDPKTFKIMFPGRRYANCIDVARTQEANEATVKPFYKVVNAYNKNKELVAVRVISIQNSVGYDLAFFGNTWSEPSQLMNYLDIAILKMLIESDALQHFNCGAASSPQLKNFKNHIPSYEIVSYRYKQLSNKPKLEKTTGFFSDDELK